jgi:hypothetical protein
MVGSDILNADTGPCYVRWLHAAAVFAEFVEVTVVPAPSCLAALSGMGLVACAGACFRRATRNKTDARCDPATNPWIRRPAVSNIPANVLQIELGRADGVKQFEHAT